MFINSCLQRDSPPGHSSRRGNGGTERPGQVQHHGESSRLLKVPNWYFPTQPSWTELWAGGPCLHPPTQCLAHALPVPLFLFRAQFFCSLHQIIEEFGMERTFKCPFFSLIFLISKENNDNIKKIREKCSTIIQPKVIALKNKQRNLSLLKGKLISLQKEEVFI